VHGAAVWLAGELLRGGIDVLSDDFFDTLSVYACPTPMICSSAPCCSASTSAKSTRRTVGVALDERVREDELLNLLTAFGISKAQQPPVLDDAHPLHCSAQHHRSSAFLTHPVFNSYHSETEMMRYLHRLEVQRHRAQSQHDPARLLHDEAERRRGNDAAELAGGEWPASLLPARPDRRLSHHVWELEAWLAECTGFDAVSLQPNAGSQGEYAGLLAIKRFHEARGDHHRDVCLIPTSAHGTNPASAVMCGFKVVAVTCDDQGNISVGGPEGEAGGEQGKVAALMVTYPSTHGVFEESIIEICRSRMIMAARCTWMGRT
jgi:glycine dehydrogenase